MLTASVAVPSSTKEKLHDPLIRSARHALVELLTDSFLHDARNPLNALSINLEVLAERLRREAGGALPAQYEKNIRTMREQVVRVDAMMRSFSDFIAPRQKGPETVDFSELLTKALEVIGHEGRKRQVSLRPMIDSGIKVRSGAEPSGLTYLALQPLAHAISSSPRGAEVLVTLRKEEGEAVLRVEFTSAGEQEVPLEAQHTLEVFTSQHHGRFELQGGASAKTEVRLPLA